jgi:hypothetical protein
MNIPGFNRRGIDLGDPCDVIDRLAEQESKCSVDETCPFNGVTSTVTADAGHVWCFVPIQPTYSRSKGAT